MERSAGKRIELSEEVLGRPVTAAADLLDDGIMVTVFGGEKTHIGAVTTADREGAFQTTCFPGHKESIVTQHWAQKLYERFSVPLCVVSGIHYHQLSKEGIELVLRTTDSLLEQLIRRIQIS